MEKNSEVKLWAKGERGGEGSSCSVRLVKGSCMEFADLLIFLAS